MNSRFLDPLFFLFLFALDVILWTITWMFKATPEVVAIMAPAFASLAAIGLMRSLLKLDAHRFWGGLSVVTLISGFFLWVAEILPPNLGTINLALPTSVGFMGVILLGSILGWFLAVVGAIPGPEETLDADEPQAQILDETSLPEDPGTTATE